MHIIWVTSASQKFKMSAIMLFVHLILPSMFAKDNEKSGQITSIQDVHCSQFLKTKSFENMPPTKDALKCHLKRAHY